jgi:hypothetical protein
MSLLQNIVLDPDTGNAEIQKCRNAEMKQNINSSTDIGIFRKFEHYLMKPGINSSTDIGD